MKKAIAILVCIMMILAVTLPTAAISAVNVKSIQLDKSVITLKIGETADLKVTFSPANTSQTRLTYSTSNKNVATVGSDGKITAVHNGEVTITVYTQNKSIFAKCKVNVQQSLKLRSYKLSWYYVGPGEQRDTGLVEAEINKYLADKINATLKLNLIDWATYKSKLNAMIAAGEPFDICFTASWMNDYVANSQNGAFVELDKYFEKELAGTKKILGDDFLNSTKINGHYYGIPCNKEKARDWGFVYNKTLADKYKFDMSTVKSYADIEPMLKVIKDKEPDVVPLHWEKHGPTSYIPWNAENLFNDGQITAILPDGKVVNAIETPEVKAAYQIARDFYNKGYVRKDVLTSKDGPTIRKSGKFFAFGMNLKPGYAAELNGDKTLGFVHGQVDVTSPVMTNSDTMGSLQAISKTSKDPQRTAMFLELMNTDSTLSNLVNYGIEGKHYTKVNDVAINPVKDSAYQPNMQWMFGNQMIAYLYANENPKKWDLFAEFNAKAKPAPSLGFIFNKDPVSNELAACANASKEYHEGLDCGALDPAVKLPEFISKLKAAGVDKIILEQQKQYNAWKAKK